MICASHECLELRQETLGKSELDKKLLGWSETFWGAISRCPTRKQRSIFDVFTKISESGFECHYADQTRTSLTIEDKSLLRANIGLLVDGGANHTRIKELSSFVEDEAQIIEILANWKLISGLIAA